MTRNHAADPLAEQKREVPRQFDDVAGSYDLLTGLNPGYRKHLRWSARRVEAGRRPRLLDLCCGTGLSTAALVREYPDAQIDALDASTGMLERARQKTAKGRLRARINWVHGDASDPAAAGLTGPYDGILMAYGIRNLPDRDGSLARIRELLAPGARIVFHEYSVADSRRARITWEAVTRTIIVPSGLVASGTADIYRYLRQSVLEFDGVKAFEARLKKMGYTDIHTEAMDGWQRGIVHSFVARRGH